MGWIMGKICTECDTKFNYSLGQEFSSKDTSPKVTCSGGFWGSIHKVAIEASVRRNYTSFICDKCKKNESDEYKPNKGSD